VQAERQLEAATAGNRALRAPPDRPPPIPLAANAVARAFVIGWQTAELFQHAAPRPTGARTCPAELPGLADLHPGERTELGVAEIEAALAHLGDHLRVAGGEPPSTAGLRRVLDQGDLPAIREQVYGLHCDVLLAFTAVDARFGTAFSLGRALAVTRRAGQDLASLREEFDEGRVRKLQLWLSDLRTALPEHSAVAVSQTLGHWQSWVAGLEVPDPDAWADAHGRDVHLALWRQGQIWRALLSGEKHAADMLDEEDYLNAAGRLFVHARRLAWRLVRAHLPAVITVLALTAAAAALLLSSTHPGDTIAGVGAATAALGISFAGLGRGFFKVLEVVRAPLWSAALDDETGTAATLLPKLPRVHHTRRS
jgi:hypothetical protein